MNYLAHALLAEPYSLSVIGNVAGDLVKGPLQDQALHPRVAHGLRRHRLVDVLTDGHPRYRALKALFPATQRRYAGIVLDVFFDYCLTRHWAHFSAWDRAIFVEGMYRALSDFPRMLPAPLAQVAPRWVAADWLRVYESMDGVEAVLARLSGRLRRPVDLTCSLDTLEHRAPEIEAGFLAVFAQVQQAIDGHGTKAFPTHPQVSRSPGGQSCPV
jgi:acyl carrier protein phosphodiesterase